MVARGSRGDRGSAQRGAGVRGRWACALSLGVFIAALVVLIFSSRLIGPSFAELGRLGAIELARPLIANAADDGLATLAGAEAKGVLRRIDAHGSLGVLLGAWSTLSIGRVGLLDSLTSARLPWLVLAALCPALLFALVRPSRGVGVAATAAGLLVLLGRWMHAATITDTSVTVAAVWLVVLFCHIRSIGGAHVGDRSGRRALWAIGAGLALGIGFAFARASAWVVLIVVVHYALVHGRASVRLLRRGRIPVPTSLVAMSSVGPVAAYAATPGLWGASPLDIAGWGLSPLRLDVTASEHSGRLVTAPPFPGDYTATWLLYTTPLVIVLLAALGVGLTLHAALGRRFAAGNLRPRLDRHGVAALGVVGALGVVVGPSLVPAVATPFPPRAAAALVFVAVLAAIGLHGVSGWIPRPRARPLFIAVTVAAVGVSGWYAPGTGAARFSPLIAGAGIAHAEMLLSTRDGSELSAMVPAIDELGRSEVKLNAPGVPADLWNTLARHGRMKSKIVPSESAPWTLRRGVASGGVTLHTVERADLSLWVLEKR